MSLKKVTLRNFRTCHEVELSDLGHLTVLVGRNGAGKSNILQGIERLSTIASSDKNTSKESVSCEILFALKSVNYRYSLKFPYPQSAEEITVGIIVLGLSTETFHRLANLSEHLEVQDELDKWQTVLKRTGESVFKAKNKPVATINQATSMLPAMASLLPVAITKEHILPALDFLKGIKYYAFEHETTPPPSQYFWISNLDYANWLSNGKTLNRPHHSTLMRLLDMYLNRRDDFDEVCELLGMNGLNIVRTINIKPFDIEDTTYYRIEFLPGKGWEDIEHPARLPFEKLSNGTQRIINILVSFFYDQSSVFLIEQPEDAIHSGLLYKLINLLRAYDDKGQLIMASHSNELFDLLKPEEIRLVTLESGVTKVRGLNAVELSAARNYLEREGSLSEYLEAIQDD